MGSGVKLRPPVNWTLSATQLPAIGVTSVSRAVT
jgi:hypothetical protein